MKILLYLGDAYFINGRVGVGTYHSNIIFGLNYDYDIVVPENYTAELPCNANPVHLSKSKRKFISFFKWFLPVNFFFKNYDLIVTDSCSFKKGRSSTKLFMIVHDCMTFTEPKNYTFSQRLYAKLASKTFCQADYIIAVSQTTKQTLHDIFHLPFSKIKVVPNVSSFSVESKKAKDFLYIGDMRKTKNLHNLICGFALFSKNSSSNDKLIIAGRKKYEYENLLSLVKELGIEDKVVFCGYVSDEDKIKLFEKTKALVLISDNEGFGIPLIEAARNGIPVICSDIPVFHEILDEDSAVFVDNKNEGEIADAFLAVENKPVSETSKKKVREKYSQKKFSSKLNALVSSAFGARR